MAKYRLRTEHLEKDAFVFDTDKDVAPTKQEHFGPHVGMLIALGKDNTGSLVFDQDAIEDNPDLFEKIED